MKHTPEPWNIRYFRENDPEAGFFVQGGKNDPKAPYCTEILSEDMSFYPLENRLADATLIAAAPKMLKALRSIVGIEAWIADRQMREHFQKAVYSVLEELKYVE